MTHKLIRTTKPMPYDHVTWCPLCGVELCVIRNFQDATHYAVLAIDLAIKEHLSRRHPIRYAIWSRLGKPTSRPGRWLLTRWGT
jgi:hypothetical protein